MYNVLRWLESIALAGAGLDENQIADCVRAPEVPRFAESKLALISAQIGAMKELRRNWRDMSGDKFQETMTAAHFSQYFTDAISRAFYADYEYQVGEWRDYIYPDLAPDFREIKRFRMTEPGTLLKRREKAEAKATHIQERPEVSLRADEYARQFDVSWQTILNDDLGKIRETPERMSRAASRWLDQLVSDAYDNATTQATLAALGAPWSGTGRLTLANLAIGISAMMQRTDADGNRMNIRRVYLVIPPVLKVQAAQILKDLIAYGGPNSNVLSDFIAGVKVDPYITTSGPNVPWYLIANPKEVPTITLARLIGWPGPVVYMEQSNIRVISGAAPAAFLMGNAATGDIQYFVEDVVGVWDDDEFVGVTDYRGLYYSSGTTP